MTLSFHMKPNRCKARYFNKFCFHMRGLLLQSRPLPRSSTTSTTVYSGELVRDEITVALFCVLCAHYWDHQCMMTSKVQFECLVTGPNVLTPPGGDSGPKLTKPNLSPLIGIINA